MPTPLDVDLAGRTCVVTGASSGIGQEAARALARMGARVVLACRSLERGEQARRGIAASTGSTAVELSQVDTASQASVRAFARSLRERLDRLDVLVNNAGIWSPRRRLGPDGVELTWATNVLGYTLVTDELLELVTRARGRIVNVASRLARSLDLGDVEFVRRRYTGILAYAQSKQANRLWTWALARRLEGTGVTANAMHPGGVATGLFGKGGGVKAALAGALMHLAGKSPAAGADTVVWLAASPEIAGASGRFWINRREAHCEHRDPATEEALFELCRRMTAPRA